MNGHVSSGSRRAGPCHRNTDDTARTQVDCSHQDAQRSSALKTSTHHRRSYQAKRILRASLPCIAWILACSYLLRQHLHAMDELTDAFQDAGAPVVAFLPDWNTTRYPIGDLDELTPEQWLERYASSPELRQDPAMQAIAIESAKDHNQRVRLTRVYNAKWATLDSLRAQWWFTTLFPRPSSSPTAGARAAQAPHHSRLIAKEETMPPIRTTPLP